MEQITSLRPQTHRSNLLIDATKDQYFPKAFADEKSRDISPSIDETLQAGHFCDKITYGFQLATNQGPLCNEPVQGIAVLLMTCLLPLGRTTRAHATGSVGSLARLSRQYNSPYTRASSTGLLE